VSLYRRDGRSKLPRVQRLMDAWVDRIHRNLSINALIMDVIGPMYVHDAINRGKFQELDYIGPRVSTFTLVIPTVLPLNKEVASLVCNRNIINLYILGEAKIIWNLKSFTC
jgi:hypothetical protein